MKNNKKYLYPHQVFSELTNINSFHDRVKFLQENDSFSIRTILQANFLKDIVFDLPHGSPPFTRDNLPPENSLGRIDKQIKILGKFIVVDKPRETLDRMRNETKFIQLLESINEKDADIIIAAKDKVLNTLYPVLDETLVKSAFPDLLNR